MSSTAGSLDRMPCPPMREHLNAALSGKVGSQCTGNRFDSTQEDAFVTLCREAKSAMLLMFQRGLPIAGEKGPAPWPIPCRDPQPMGRFPGDHNA